MRARPERSRLLRALALSIALSGCGAAAPEVRVTSPFTAEHVVAFDNGVDYIYDPAELGDGNWLRQWQDEIDRRVTFADAIAIVRVTTMREDGGLERPLTHRLVVHVDDDRHGDLPDEVTLSVAQGERGFATVDGDETRILNQRFIAFVKWAEDEQHRIVPKWHLSPASQPVIRRVNSLIEREHVPAGQRRRVIIRDSRVDDDAEE